MVRKVLVSLPRDLVVKFNVAMRARGFSNGKDYIIHLILRDVEKLVEENPEIGVKIAEMEKIHGIKKYS